GGQHLDLERVDESRGFERLVPPRRAVDQRLANRLGRAVVHVIDNRLHRFRLRRRGVLLLEAVTGDQPALERRRDRRRVVVGGQRGETHARVETAGLVAGRRQLHKRVVLAHGQRRWRRRRLAHQRPWRVALERQRRFHFRVLREALRARKENGGARLVETAAPLPDP